MTSDHDAETRPADEGAPPPPDPETRPPTDTETPREAPVESGGTPPKALEPGGLTPPATPPPDTTAPDLALARAALLEPPCPGTRVVGAVWLAFGAFLVWFFASQAFGSDLGTENVRLRAVIRAAAVIVPAYPALLGLAALLTGRRPDPRWNLLSLPFEAWWYSTLGTMTWREMKGFFGRPVAYIVIFFWLAVNGYFFLALLEYYGGPDSWGKDFQDPPSLYVTGNFVVMFALAFMCPALTMRLLAEESSNGSLEMLLTSPVTDAQVALSKFLGALSFYAAMLLGIAAYLLILRQYASEWDWGPVLGGYLGLLLLGAFFLSIGLFTSSVTDNQIVAFILAVLPNLFLVFIFLVQNVVPFDWAKDVIRHVNVWDLHQEFVKGIVQWRALAFYLSSTIFFLFLAVRGVESHTWR
ncbi:MAG: ABC transporter permease [Planctomycetes bacterium]|nr:ABC transporter permease [Planctomycetota bacterium]